MIKQVITAFSAYLKVPAATFRYGLIRYHLLTGLVSLVLGVLIVYSAWSYGDDVGAWLTSFLPWADNSVVSQIGAWTGRLSALIVGVILYKHLVLVSVSPIMSPLSERIERYHLQGANDKPLSLTQWAKDILRGAAIATRNVTRELLITIPLILLGFIPGLAVVTTPLVFIVQAYYMGFGNIDYYLERHCGVRAAARYVRQHKWLAIANGSVFLVLLAIPFVGFFIAPALGATAASIAVLEGGYAVEEENLL